MTDHRPAVVAGFLGWALDAFDFFVVVMTLTAIAREFGRSDAEIACCSGSIPTASAGSGGQGGGREGAPGPRHDLLAVQQRAQRHRARARGRHGGGGGQTVEAVRAELIAGFNPGVRLVPAHTMALGLAQEHGCTDERL